MVNLSLETLTDTILVRGARQLLTLRGTAGPRRGLDLQDLQIISDGSLLIKGGIIKQVGPTRRIENLASARGATEINAAGKVVMPGFVDSHTHLAFPPPGADNDRHQAALRTLRRHTAKRLRGCYRGYLAAMARHGTTTVEIKTGGGLDHDAEFKLLRILSSLDGDPIDVLPTLLLRIPPQNRGAAMASVVADLLPRIRRRALARFAEIVCEEGRADLEDFHAYLAAAHSLGFVPKILAGPRRSSESIDLAIQSHALTVGNLDRVTEAEVRLLARSNTVATLIPGTAQCDADAGAGRILANSGAAFALATGFNPDRSGTLSMQAVVALAHRRMALPLEQAISAATINGAHALGCADATGSLEPGKIADLLLLDTGDFRDLGTHFGANIVCLAMKRGRLIYRQPEVAPAPPARKPLSPSVLQ